VRSWPIRVRLTLGFAAVMALVLVLVGMFSYTRLAAGLSDDLNRQLQQRAQDLSRAAGRPGSTLASLAGTGFIERGESFAELLATDGTVLESTTTLHGRPVLTPDQAAQAASGTSYVDLPHAPGLDEPARLLATPLRRGGQTVILVVGNTTQDGAEELARVRREMLTLGPLLLLVMTGIAYLMTGAALRPVEAMRRRAAAMSAGTSGQRLPLPPARDEMARLGTTLNDLLARVDDAMERERSFVANASHELRTPLALLRTELELAIRRPRPASDLVAAISSAGEEVDRLSRLADDLLVLARSSDDGLPVAISRVALPDLLRASADRFTRQARDAGRAIATDPGDVASIEVDPVRLAHAVDNLIDNALRHGKGDVEVCARSTADAVEIHVLDEGPGFAADLHPLVFDRFVRSPTSSGAGLGLAIVAALAHAHGGSAGSANRPSGGADVWISLPLSRSP
jgi:two-component system, OmpR family, sensor kinase